MKVGIRVEVQLRNKKYSGIVKKINSKKPTEFSPKEILNVLDEEPIVYEKQLQLWNWIAKYYMSSEGEVMQAALPANLKLNSETVLIWNDEVDFDTLNISDFTDNEYIVVEALEIKKELRVSEVQLLINTSNIYNIIKKIIEKNICFVWEELKIKYKPKNENYVHLESKYEDDELLANLLNNWSKAPKQLELLLAYLHLIKTTGEVVQSELLKKANASLAQLKGLVEKNIITIEKRQIDRINYATHEVNIDFKLTINQTTALQKIQQSFQEKNVCLLHGITSSGKTLVYIKLIEEYINRNEQVLFLVPEIALTTQIIRRLQKHFGGLIAIYHSKFNSNERVEIWNKVKAGEIKIVLGARSAIFQFLLMKDYEYFVLPY